MWQVIVLLTFSGAVDLLEFGNSSDINIELDEPLFLTPYLDRREISEAKKLSKVTPDIGNKTSYSGYFTVDKIRESHLFFWFFPAQEDSENAPVILWVQGGPGMSSLTSLFEEIGPLTYDHSFGFGKRKYSWDIKHNLIFLDQPVGAGFSFSGTGTLAENRKTYTEDLYSALLQFFKLFPEMLRNKFIIAGHSYAGHFIPALGHLIHTKNPSAEVKINLDTMMIGNGFMDAFYQSDYGGHLYHLGLVDEIEKKVFDKYHENLISNLKNKNWEEAFKVLYGDILSTGFVSFVGNVSKYNFLEPKSKWFQECEEFIQQKSIRKAIHVGNTNCSTVNYKIGNALSKDIVQSVKPLVEDLLEHYPIVFYTGQLDIIVGYPMVSNFLKSLEWSGKDVFKNATRSKWCVEDEQAGYIKSGHNLHDVLVRNAGHTVPRNQPFWAFTLVNSVASSPNGNPFQALKTCNNV